MEGYIIKEYNSTFANTIFSCAGGSTPFKNALVFDTLFFFGNVLIGYYCSSDAVLMHGVAPLYKVIVHLPPVTQPYLFAILQ